MSKRAKAKRFACKDMAYLRVGQLFSIGAEGTTYRIVALNRKQHWLDAEVVPRAMPVPMFKGKRRRAS